MKKFLMFTVIFLALGWFFLTTKNSGNSEILQSRQAPRVVDGKQFIDITAKGGYWPRITEAKAGIPTTLNVYTSGTFDCSSAFVIPSLRYRTNLPPSGVTAVEIPAQEKGSVLRGTCSMGMYNFAINFN